jgi:hypothetical protein
MPMGQDKNVVPFSLARFSSSDLLKIGEVMERRLGLIWSRTERETSPDSDTITIWSIGSSKPTYRLERDKTGWYYLMFRLDAEWKLLASGTLDDCLSLYHPAIL